MTTVRSTVGTCNVGRQHGGSAPWLKRLLHGLIILCFVLCSGAVRAQQDKPEPPAETESEKQDSTERSDSDADDEPLEIFIPSEKISADGSISFPADI